MANQIINSNNLTSKEIPELYVRYFNPKIKINTEITIPYYVSDSTQAEYLNNSNAKSFTTIVTFNSKTFSSTTTAGEFTINIGSISTVGETYFSIYTIDGNGVASVEQFFDILIIDGAYPITQDQTYTMTSSDLNTYNIKAGESVSISDAKINGASLTNLFKGIKDKGYRKIIMLNNTYMIDYHGDKVTLPDQFTVDMNGATFKATQCTDINVANILDLKDCFDSHVMNGKLVGNYDGFDFEATKNTTNYYIPGEGLAVAEINGAKYSSFENMDMSYSVGYNLGVFGGKRSGYVGTPGKLAFKNQYYIDANGNQINSSYLCTTDITDISILSDRGEFQCSVYLGYGGLALNKAELFIHFYDSSQKYLKTTKTRQYQIVKIPSGAKYVRITGFTPVTESSGMTICHTGHATNCELINIKSHNTRTCAMHPGIYNHLLIKDCTFNKVADENEYKVTKLALDFEDGYENGRNLFFINNEVYDGTSALTIQKCFNCNVIKCRNFGLDLRGHIKGALIKNNFFNEGSIYTTNFDSQSHMKLDNNTFFRSLKFLKWDNNGNYPTVGLTNLDCKQNYQNNSNTNVIIDNAVSGSGSGGAPSQTYYNIINNISNCTTNNSDNLVLKDSSYKATITPKSGYDITSITVTMGGVDITSTALSGHVINIAKVTGNVVINVITIEIESYRITNKLTNCTNSNSASTILKNGTYSGTIVANGGYNLYSLIVTMDGVDITSTSVSGNSINVSRVTGDIIITAICTTEVTDIIYDNGTLNKGTFKLTNATAESTYIRINQSQESSVVINDYKLTLNKNDKIYMDIGLDTDSPSTTYSIRIPQLGDSSVNNFTNTNMIDESQISNALNGKDKVTIYWTLYNTVTNIDLTLMSYFARVKIFKIWIDKNSTESGGGDSSDTEYATSCTSAYILDKIYPMPQNHEALPSGVNDTWGTQSRWENQQRPTAAAHNCGQANCPGAVQFKALGAWSNVYRVKNSGFSSNTGVEMRNIKVYGWYNGQWEKVQDLAVPNGNFYAESFSGDSNQYFSDSVKTTSTSKTIILREANKVNNENCMYHPFSNIKNFDLKYEYVYTCIDLRKVKWDENGVDDRDSSHYCSNCGGDWWLAEGLTFDSSWQHNKGICQPKMVEITNNWRRFSMTTVPQGWTNGFPQ